MSVNNGFENQQQTLRQDPVDCITGSLFSVNSHILFPKISPAVIRKRLV